MADSYGHREWWKMGNAPYEATLGSLDSHKHKHTYLQSWKMGNTPSEATMGSRLRCSKCRKQLCGCVNHDDYFKIHIYGRYVYKYNGGDYYRPVGADMAYECAPCFHGAPKEELRCTEEARQEARGKAEEELRQAEDAQRQAEEERREAEEERRQAEEAQRQAEEERRQAEQARRQAEEARRCTEVARQEARGKAEEAQRQAADERRQAEEERRQAEQARRQAEEAQRQAEKARKEAEEARRCTEEARREVMNQGWKRAVWNAASSFIFSKCSFILSLLLILSGVCWNYEKWTQIKMDLPILDLDCGGHA
ncbi:uncharacterized protein LOC134459602 [Engraulis encrasicolus]|uniref:uncharacterized protein LOC134459602 n=1 Tax=Engraulis encrasicolus TaxID=184585 RepID=UPI002FD50772